MGEQNSKQVSVWWIYGAAAFAFLLLCVVAGGDKWLGYFVIGSLMLSPTAYFPYAINRNRKLIVSRDHELRERNVGSTVNAGTYLMGHPGQSKSVACDAGIADGKLAFVPRYKLSEFRPFVIPCADIVSVETIDESSSVTTQTSSPTVLRLATLGVFALAFPKSSTATAHTPTFVVAITWQANGIETTTCFVFDSSVAANRLMSLALSSRGTASFHL